MQSDKCNGVQHKDSLLRTNLIKGIINEMIEDAVWELSFEVHRAAKLGYLFLEPEEENSESLKREKPEEQNPGKKSQVKQTVQCAVCGKYINPIVYAKHLASCMKIKDSGRTASKKALHKIAEQNSNTISDDESDVEAKKRRAPKPQVVNINDMQEMTLEKRKKFFNKFCGVVTKQGSKLCTKTAKCTQHIEEEKRKIRFTFLDNSNQCENEQIDVDTVEEEAPWFYNSMHNNSIAEDISQEVFSYPTERWSISTSNLES